MRIGDVVTLIPGFNIRRVYSWSWELIDTTNNSTIPCYPIDDSVRIIGDGGTATAALLDGLGESKLKFHSTSQNNMVVITIDSNLNLGKY